MAEETRSPRTAEPALDHSDMLTTYANWYQVLGTPEEVMVELAVTPALGVVTADPIHVKHRVVLSFQTAKRLAAHLHYAIRRYESVFGEVEIDIPTRIRKLAEKKAG
jgi:hypothetical protein